MKKLLFLLLFLIASFFIYLQFSSKAPDGLEDETPDMPPTGEKIKYHETVTGKVNPDGSVEEVSVERVAPRQEFEKSNESTPPSEPDDLGPPEN